MFATQACTLACNALGASDGVIHNSVSLEDVSLRAAATLVLSEETHRSSIEVYFLWHQLKQ